MSVTSEGGRVRVDPTQSESRQQTHRLGGRLAEALDQRHTKSVFLLGLLLTVIPVLGCPQDSTTGVLGVGITAGDCVTPPNDQEMAQAVLQLVNRERTSRQLQPLTMNPLLVEAAASYACEMIDGEFFSHTNPLTGEGPGQRAVKAGYAFVTLGENLAAGQHTPEQVMSDWMSSTAGHRENILYPDWKEIGIGVRTGGPHGVYWVQEFGDPP